MNIKCNEDFNFFKVKNILLVTEDNNIKDTIKENFESDFNSFICKKSLKNINNYYDFHLIIIDISTNNIFEVVSVLTLQAKETPVIFISNEFENNLFEYINRIKLKNIISKDSIIEYFKYYVGIILKESNLIHFNDGFSFDLNNENFYKNEKIVNLTILETRLLKYLIKHRYKIVTYDEIKNNVWKDKKYSTFAMRNIVKKIRDKSSPNIIHNLSKNGYELGNYYIFS